MVLRGYDAIMEPFYPHAWSLESRCSYYCRYRPQHVLLAGELTSKTFRQRKKCSQKLARVTAALVDCGVKYVSLCDTRAKWHFEDANQFMMALSYYLQELGYKPLVSFVNKTYDRTCFFDAPGSDSTDSDLDDGSSGVVKLKVLILSPAAERTDFKKADVLIDLLDRRHGHERIVEIAQKAMDAADGPSVRHEPFTVDSLIAELPGLCPDVSGKFCSFPNLCVLYSNQGYKNVAGIPPWLLRKSILANGRSLRGCTVSSTWRAMKKFDRWMCSKSKG